MSTVVVVGAGVAGLASAALLARDGHQVTVLEAHDGPGGRAGRWASAGFTFDTGPSWYLMPEVFEHFFALLGTSTGDQLELMPLDPAYWVFFERHDPVDVFSDRDSAIALFEGIEPGAGVALARYLDSAADTYRMAVRRFLYTTYASLVPLARPDVLARTPRLVALLGRSLAQRIARDFHDTRLRQILGYPAVFLGSAPSRTPAMYHLMSHLDLTDGVRYPRGGFARVVDVIEDLARAEGVTLHYGSEVTAITTRARTRGTGTAGRGGRAEVTGVRYRDGSGRDRTLAAEIVVSGADLHHTEQELLGPEVRSRSPRWWRSRSPGPGAVLVHLGVRGSLPELEHHSLFFTEDWDATFDRIFPAGRGAAPAPGVPDPTSLYVCRPSATDPGVAPAGSETLFVLVPVPADPGLGHGGVDGAGDRPVEAIADAAVSQISRWAGVPDLADRIAVRRTVGPADFAEDLHAWRGSALGPAHTLAQSAMFRAGNASRRVAGLFHVGGTVTPGIGLPMCLISAELVVKRLRGDTSTEALPTPLRPRQPRERVGGVR